VKSLRSTAARTLLPDESAFSSESGCAGMDQDVDSRRDIPAQAAHRLLYHSLDNLACEADYLGGSS